MRLLPALLFFLALHSTLQAQKQIYIPNEWAGGSFDYSLERSAESENFVIFWGPLAGLDPTQAPANIQFDPEFILETAEDLYTFYIDSIGFLSDSSGLLSEWKMIIVLLHTWDNLEGWAFGGNYDGITGAMWMHPHAASDGPTLAHEFNHALQNYAWMMFPGHSFINHDYVGSFWETHAEFMAMQYYPSVAQHFDMARWLNTSSYHWSSTRHHYQAFVFLQFIKETDGLELIHRMWREALIGEHPLQTYMRFTGRSQQELNDLFGEYAMRNVTWDYAIGDLLRERVSTLPEVFLMHPTLIPDAPDQEKGYFQIQDHRAPQDYGYNHIRLIPVRSDSCEESVVQVHFKGYSDAAADAGWRWGLVALTEEGSPRYSVLMADDGELIFPLEDDEVEVFLVVSGAPSQHHNYAWEAGFPRIYHYPYAFRVSGAWPEGYQPGYTRFPENLAGAPHPNGGGFVASSASVSPSAFVDKHACVLDQAQVLDQARIEGFAMIKHNAVIQNNAIVQDYAVVGENAQVRDQAIIKDHARVWGGNQVYGDAIIRGHSIIFNSSVYEQAELTDNTFCWGATLFGSIHLGGDAEYFGSCDAGTYLQVQGAYGRECDGLDIHPANEYLNKPYLDYQTEDLAFLNEPDCGYVVSIQAEYGKTQLISLYPNPFDHQLILDLGNPSVSITWHWKLISTSGVVSANGQNDGDGTFSIDTGSLPNGMYILHLSSNTEVFTRVLTKH